MKTLILLIAIALGAEAKKDDNNGRGNAYGHGKKPKQELPTAETPEPGTFYLLLGGGAIFAGIRAVRNRNK